MKSDNIKQRFFIVHDGSEEQHTIADLTLYFLLNETVEVTATAT